MKVAQYIDLLIDASPKTLRQIADEVGFPKPNVISMIRTGDTKVPVARAASLAIALGADPRDMLVRVLREQQPETWDAISTWLLPAAAAEQHD